MFQVKMRLEFCTDRKHHVRFLIVFLTVTKYKPENRRIQVVNYFDYFSSKIYVYHEWNLFLNMTDWKLLIELLAFVHNWSSNPSIFFSFSSTTGILRIVHIHSVFQEVSLLLDRLRRLGENRLKVMKAYLAQV